MRTIDNQWADLSAGYQAARQFETRLRREWGPQVESIYRSQQGRRAAVLEARRLRLSKEAALERPRYERRLRHWQLQRQNYLARLRSWQADLRRSRLLFFAPLSFSILVCLASTFAVVIAPLNGMELLLPFALALLGAAGAIGLGIFSFLRYQVLKRFEKTAPVEPLSPEKPRVLRELEELEKALIGSGNGHFPFTVLPAWWDGLCIRDMDAAKDYGSLGVNDLLQRFASYLPDSYLAFRELLVRPGLDADVLLLGPSGIWILEVKHFAGQVTYEHGQGWRQHKEYFEKGGILDSRDTYFDINLDEQWLREKSNVEETIRRRLPSYAWLIPHIHGGIAFTHNDVQLDIDSASRAECRRTDEWLQAILHTPTLSKFGVEDQVKVADALINFASTLSPFYGVKSAVDLARRQYELAGAQVQEYISG